MFDLDVQVKGLEQRLSETTASKTTLEERVRTSEHFIKSLETELQTTKASLEARQNELKEVQDKVICLAEYKLHFISW